jgi:hypothetical protein
MAGGQLADDAIHHRKHGFILVHTEARLIPVTGNVLILEKSWPLTHLIDED